MNKIIVFDELSRKMNIVVGEIYVMIMYRNFIMDDFMIVKVGILCWLILISWVGVFCWVVSMNSICDVVYRFEFK